MDCVEDGGCKFSKVNLDLYSASSVANMRLMHYRFPYVGADLR